MEYSARIDEHISQLLSQRGKVTPDMIAGFDEGDAARFLARYVEIHNHEVPLVFDGEVMTWAAATVASEPYSGSPAVQMPPTVPSPVDQVMSMDTSGSLLDTERSGGKVAGWMWILPLTIGLPGGIAAWFLARDTNRSTAKALLWVGVAITVVSALMAIPAGNMLKDVQSGGAAPANVAWPASSAGKPTFYYFGAPT